MNKLKLFQKNEKEIIDKANLVYKNSCNNKMQFYINNCCDFQKLEKNMK